MSRPNYNRVSRLALSWRDLADSELRLIPFCGILAGVGLAGGWLAGLGWCEEMGCGLGFVVERAEWTAGVLAGMLEGV